MSTAEAPGNTAHCKQQHDTYGYATLYVAIVAGHIHEGEKARIYGKGAEMCKSIYKRVHNTGN